MNHFAPYNPLPAGIQPRALSQFLDRLSENGCHSVMIVRHGKVAAEGWWQPHSPEECHVLYSLSKSLSVRP